MFKIPQPPTDSMIQTEQTCQGLEFKWRALPISSITRAFISLFFLALLIIWTLGGISALWALFFKKFSLVFVFLGFWLIFWIYGERFFIRVVYELLFDLGHTERLILEDSELTYYPGSMFNSSFGRSWGPKPFNKLCPLISSSFILFFLPLTLYNKICGFVLVMAKNCTEIL